MPEKRERGQIVTTTNWEKYFGTPAKASRTTVQWYGNRIAVEHKGHEVVDLPKRRYKAWLESKSNIDWSKS